MKVSCGATTTTEGRVKRIYVHCPQGCVVVEAPLFFFVYATSNSNGATTGISAIVSLFQILLHYDLFRNYVHFSMLVNE